MEPEEHRLTFLYQRTKARSNKSAQRLELGRREVRTLQQLMRLKRMSFPSSGLVVDLGCGDRFLETPFREAGLDYIGLDADTVDFEEDKFPLEDESAELIVSLAVLEHLRDPSLFLSEIYRCLAPDGVLFLSTPNFRIDYRNFYNDPTHVKPYTPTSLEGILGLYGFSKVSTHPGVRCKSDFWYTGRTRFWRARYLLPFRGDRRWAPSFLKGHAKSIFALAQKQPSP